MARFVSTDGISSSIEQIIKNSNKKLTLISPYLNPSTAVYEALAEAEDRNVKITLIYGKKKQLISEVEMKLFLYKNIQIYYNSNLHAKCYFNENMLLITSMNLINYSEENNHEMGLFVIKDEDPEIFNDALKECKLITQKSELVKKFGKDTVSIYDHLIELNREFSNDSDFYYPSLFKIFKEKYPKYKDKISINRILKIEDFPNNGIDILISNRVNILPRDKEEYGKIRKINEGYIEAYLPKLRFYWNINSVSVYAELHYEPLKNNNGLRIHLRKMISIIDTLHKHLKTKID